VATEKGVISRVTPTSTWVKTTRSDACQHCASKDSCQVLGDGQEVEVEALNIVGAKAGDRVVLTFETAPFLKATFLLYVFPIICMLIGAIIGQRISEAFMLDESVLSAVFAFLSLFLAVLVVRRKANRLAGRKEYRPQITRVLRG
jgi:sigma-E factor negative regulatory protein RseC